MIAQHFLRPFQNTSFIVIFHTSNGSLQAQTSCVQPGCSLVTAILHQDPDDMRTACKHYAVPIQESLQLKLVFPWYLAFCFHLFE